MRFLLFATCVLLLVGCASAHGRAPARSRVLAHDIIPAIVQPSFDPPSAVRRLIRPNEDVVGVIVDGRPHAYPIALLSLHEVVDDGPVVVSWCPLCHTALAFERRVGGRLLTFGVGGLLHANQLLYDRQTGSRWSQLLGRAVAGPYRGTPLQPVPVSLVTFAQWTRAHPHTLVLSVRRDPEAHLFTHPYAYTDFRGEESSTNPYLAYGQKVTVEYSERAGGLAGGALVLGLRIGGTAKAYPLQLLRGPIRDRVAGHRLRIVPDLQALSANVYEGVRRLPATTVYWFAWHAFFPRSLVYRVKNEEAGSRPSHEPPAGG